MPFLIGGMSVWVTLVVLLFQKVSVATNVSLLLKKKLLNVTVVLKSLDQTRPKLNLEALANGELNQLEHYMCIMGPGGPGETWEKCTADCICEQPFCNCEPPEDRDQIREGFTRKWDLRDTTIICYN